MKGQKRNVSVIQVEVSVSCGSIYPRRAQNLLAGCTYDRRACQKCFCVTLDKSNRTAHDGIRDSYVHTARLRSAGLKKGG